MTPVVIVSLVGTLGNKHHGLSSGNHSEVKGIGLAGKSDFGSIKGANHVRITTETDNCLVGLGCRFAHMQNTMSTNDSATIAFSY